jgi:hypothetical protein
MMNLILQHTAPITKTRAKLHKRYAKPAMVTLPGSAGAESMEVILPPQIAEVDRDLVRLEAHVKNVILDEYGQLEPQCDPEMSVSI